MISIRILFCLACFTFVPSLLPAATLDEGRQAYLSENYKKAMKILQPLAQEGDAKAQEMVAIMYDFGNGVAKDSSKAMSWYEKSARQGNLSLQHDLGIRYFKGDRVEQDYQKAFYWWKLAAESGVLESQYNLGLMYVQGLGTEKDPVAAVKWYEKAAGQGHINAQYSLGIMYAFGQGVAVDYEKALAFFEVAANAGVPQAQYNLGVLYEHGRGTEVDYDKAKFWYEKAAAKGVAQAKLKVAKPKPVPVRSTVLSDMSEYKAQTEAPSRDQAPQASAESIASSAVLVKKLSEELQEERRKVASLSSEVTDKLLEIERLNHLVSENEESAFTLDQKITQMNRQLEESRNQVSSLKRQLEAQRSEEQELNGLVESINTEKESVELALAENRKASEQLKFEIDTLKNAAKKSAITDREQQKLEKQYQDALAENRHLEQELQSVRANVSDLQSLLAANEEVKVNLKEVARLEQLAARGEQDKVQLDNQVTLLNKQLSESRNQVQDLKNQLNNRLNEERELRTLMEEIKSDKDRIEQALAANLTESEQLKTEIGELKSIARKSFKTEQELELLEQEFDQMLAEKQKLEREFSGAEVNIENLQAMLEARDTGEDKLGELVNSLNLEQEKIQQELAAKEAESQVLRSQIAELKAVANKSSALVATQDQLEQELETASGEKAQLAHQLDTALANVTRLEQTVDRINRQNNLAKNEQRDLAQKYADAVRLADSQTKELSFLQEDKQKLLGELAKLNQQMAQSGKDSRELLLDVKEKSARLEQLSVEHQASVGKQKALEQDVASLSAELTAARETIRKLQAPLEQQASSPPILKAQPKVKVSRYTSFAGKSNWGRDKKLFTEIHREDWIKNQDPNHYVLQLIALPNRNFVSKFFDMYPLQEAEKAYFVSRKGKREIYNIIYGVYENRSAALRGLDSLPEGVRKKEPMVRNYAVIQRYLSGSQVTVE